MPVDRADVVEAELFEHRARHHHALRVFLEFLCELEHRRKALQHLLARLLRGRVELAAHQTRQIPIQPAHGGRDRHIVVVQDHEQAHVVGHAGIIERLERHAGAHRAVADYRDRMTRRPLIPCRHCHAERG